MNIRIGGHAVVLGAGMAGLFTSRVLADSYDRVTLVDRDTLSEAVEQRRGLPQAGHLHGLLARGQQVAEELFPGITEEMISAGAHNGDVAKDVRWIINGQHLQRAESGLTVLTCTRPFLERHVRDRVAALPQVKILEGMDIIRPTLSPGRDVVTGVVVRCGDVEKTIDADLVIDATGRGSRTPYWLEESGYARPPEEKHRIGLGYTTRFYRTSDALFEGDISINTVASAGVPRGAICQRVDGERTIVTAYGILWDHPPTDPEGFSNFLKSLAAPDIYRLLGSSEPLTEPVGYRFPANLRRRYENMVTFPEGFLVIGDAVCSFNPSYAQGMTVAALGSLVLRDHLTKSERPDAVRFFEELAANVVDGVWQMAVGADLSFPGVEGQRDEAVLQSHAHITRVQHAAVHSGAVAAAYARVIGLVDQPTSLTQPGFLKVLENVEKGKVRA